MPLGAYESGWDMASFARAISGSRRAVAFPQRYQMLYSLQMQPYRIQIGDTIVKMNYFYIVASGSK